MLDYQGFLGEDQVERKNLQTRVIMYISEAFRETRGALEWKWIFSIALQVSI